MVLTPGGHYISDSLSGGRISIPLMIVIKPVSLRLLSGLAVQLPQQYFLLAFLFLAFVHSIGKTKEHGVRCRAPS